MYFKENLSAARITSYRSLIGLDSTVKTSQVVDIYTSIQTLSALLYPAFQFLEVVLRNRLIAEFQKEFQENESDNESDLWFVKANLGTETTNIFNNTYKKTRKDFQKKGRRFSHDDFVCKLTLGNWVHLLQKKNRKNNVINNFWGVKFKIIFPGIGNERITIGSLYEFFDILLDKRNRLFHHEPIWKSDELLNEAFHAKDIMGKYSDICDEILNIFDLIIKGLHYCSPKMSLYIKDKYRNAICREIANEKQKIRLSLKI